MAGGFPGACAQIGAQAQTDGAATLGGLRQLHKELSELITRIDAEQLTSKLLNFGSVAGRRMPLRKMTTVLASVPTAKHAISKRMAVPRLWQLLRERQAFDNHPS